MMTPTVLGFGILLFGALVSVFAVVRASAEADRERHREAAHGAH